MPGSPRSPTDLLAHTLITGKEKSHSSELLGILNEALVKMALNVTEHRKTPVLHSTVGCLPLPVPESYEQRLLGYCKISPPPPCSCSPGSFKALPPDRVGPHITCLIPQKYAKHVDPSPFSLGRISKGDPLLNISGDKRLLTFEAKTTWGGRTQHRIIFVHLLLTQPKF